MKAFLTIDGNLYEEMMAHLLFPDIEREQAAFMFARSTRADHEVKLDVIEARKLGTADFTRQDADCLELKDATRASLIKRAHDLGTSLIEIHSHLGPWPAGFSDADRTGLKETVPHMWWRLKKQPYLALVVAESSFDALFWLDNDKVPRRLDALLVGERVLMPTNHSLGGWG